jgi:hypothetical protein
MRFLALIFLLLAQFAHCADWDIDPAFGTGGKQTLAFDAGGAFTDRIVKILRYPDNFGGKYVAVGSASLAAGGIGIALARFNADGSLDGTFGSSGKVLKDACMTAVTNAAFDSNFRIIVVGTTSCSGNATSDAAVVRFTSVGADDLTFAGDGGVNVKFRPNFDVSDFGGAVLVLSDDSLLVGGNTSTNAAYVQKISAAGVVSNLPPAETFSTANLRRIVDVTLGQANSSFWLISQENQTLNTPGAIWKINNATLADDTDFDSSGEIFSVVTSNAGVFASCGRGAEHKMSSLVRIGARIYAFGYTTTGYSFMWGAGENDGTSRQYRCIEAGSTPVNFNALAAEASSDAGGSIYLGGACGAPENFCLWRTVRFDAGGTSFKPDITFNGGVPVSVRFSAGSGQTPQSDAFSMVRHGNKTVLAGFRVYNLSSSDFDFALARFGPDSPEIFKNGFQPGNPISRRALASLLNPQEIFLNRQYTWVLRSIGKSPVNSKSCAIIAPSNGISGLKIKSNFMGSWPS